MMQRRHFIQCLSLATASTALPSLAQSQTSTTLSPPYLSYKKEIKQAPFGNEVSRSIVNYNRVSPYIANAGLLLGEGLSEAKNLGFKLVIDLRAPDEKGALEEEQLANELGINYQRIVVGRGAPDWDQIDKFSTLVENAEHYPILVHCVSSNRSGAIWALYRAKSGIPPIIAIEEGRAAGLESRENAVRKMLNAS